MRYRPWRSGRRLSKKEVMPDILVLLLITITIIIII
jgi:hypothetical protein